MGQIFLVIELILKLFGLYDQFLDWSDKKRIADAEENRQKRNQAIDDEKNASTEDEFDKAQSEIIDHKPRP